MSIGDIIRSERINKGMTQEELADKVGVQKSAIAKWENGRVSEIKRTNIKNLADVLGINPNLLLGNDRYLENGEQKEPPAEGERLTESQKKLIEFAKGLSEDQAEKMLQLMQSILAFDR